MTGLCVKKQWVNTEGRLNMVKTVNYSSGLVSRRSETSGDSKREERKNSLRW